MNPTLPSPLPHAWAMSRDEYSAIITNMLLESEARRDAAAATLTQPTMGLDAANLRLQKLQKKQSQLTDSAFKISATIDEGVARTRARQKVEAEIESVRATIEQLSSNISARWNTLQAANVEYACEHLAQWIEDGAIQIYRYQKGEAMLTFTDHDNLVVRALVNKQPVPESVLANHRDSGPGLIQRAERIAINEQSRAEIRRQNQPHCAQTWTQLEAGIISRDVGYGRTQVIPSLDGSAYIANFLDGGCERIGVYSSQLEAMTQAEAYLGIPHSREIVPNPLPQGHPLLAYAHSKHVDTEAPPAQRG